MSDVDGSAVSIIRRDQLRRGVRAVLGVSAGAATVVIGFLCLLTPTHRGSKGLAQFADTLADGTRWLVANVGAPALADAGWILPSLLAVVVGIYASDYGARRRLSARVDLLAVSEDERTVLRLLNATGILIAAFAVDYFVLGVLTVVGEGRDLGHLIGIAVLGLIIVALGISVGAFAIESPQRLLRANNISFRELRARELRIADDANTNRPRLVMTVWLLAPWALFGISLVLVVIASGSSTFYWVSWSALTVAWLSPAVAIAGSRQRDLRASDAAAKVSAAWVILTCVLWSWIWLDTLVPIAVAAGPRAIAAMGIGAVVIVVYGIAWFSPTSPARRPRWSWTPGAAHQTSMRRGILRRAKRLLAVRERIENYERELADSVRGASESPRRRTDVLVAGRMFARRRRRVDS